MGSLERRARRLEETAELKERLKQAEAERVLEVAISRMDTAELEAMYDYLDSVERDEWAEGDEPLMLRLLEVMQAVRREEAGEFPWQAQMGGDG